MLFRSHEDNLVERLANHLKSAIYRYENNIKIENALLEDIKSSNSNTKIWVVDYGKSPDKNIYKSIKNKKIVCHK